jgi:prophage maintenance system killer protein
VIALEVADLVLIASRTLGLDTGQTLDLVDVAAAENALAAARPGAESADPALGAAALLHALARQRPLRRGNQQVALAAMLQFLAINGWDMDPDPPGPIAAMVAGLAAGTAGTEDAAALLGPRLRPSNQRTKEAPMRTGKFRPRPALSLAARTKHALLDPRRTRVHPRGFTDRHKQAVDLAIEQARQLGHDYLGTEHLLLGLLAAGDGVAVQVLESMGISPEEVRHRIEGVVGRGHGPGTRAARILPTPQARMVLGLTMREALALGHNDIGTGHLLLALLREGHGIAAQVLTALGADYDRVRQHVLDLIASVDEQAGPQTRLVRMAIPADLANNSPACGGKEKPRLTPKTWRPSRPCGTGKISYGLTSSAWSGGGRQESTSRPSSPRTSVCTANSTGCAACSASTASSRTTAPLRPPDSGVQRIAGRSWSARCSASHGPVGLPGVRATSSGVPSATMRPPSGPPPGPMSMR